MTLLALSLPDPLHPAAVHVPLALAFLMPLVVVVVGFAIWQGWFPRRTWALVVILQAVLVGSGWFALRTGAAEEERVEAVTGDDAIHEHEEAAERLVLGAGVVLGVAVLALLLGGAGRIQQIGSALTLLGSVVVLLLAVQAGHRGGELVWRHGAADAYRPADGWPAPAGDDDGEGRGRGRGRGGDD